MLLDATAPPQQTRRDGTAPADAPGAALKILAAKLQRPAECFGSNRAFLRGVAQLGGFLARTSDGEPGWQTLWKGWSVLMTLVEGYELAQTITSANRNVGETQPFRYMGVSAKTYLFPRPPDNQLPRRRPKTSHYEEA